MKKYIIGSILFIIIIISVLLFTNETFLKTQYSNKALIPKYSYFISEAKLSLVEKDACCDTSIELLSLKSVKSFEEFRDSNIHSLESCYDESYFYDSKNNITYSAYEIEKGILFNKIKITFANTNICEDEFILDSDWLNDFKESDITSFNLNYELLIEKLENSIKVESDEILPFDDTYQVSYLVDGVGYTVYFTVHSDNIMGVILSDANDAKKYSLYDIDQNVETFFQSLK